MHKFTSLAAASLLLAATHALPNSNPHQPRATDAAEVTDAADTALEPWVTVDESGKPSTVTPVLSTISGTPTVISGAPHDVTATVYTYTSLGKVITSTGAPPAPTAGSSKTGTFELCENKDGDYAPWCRPQFNSTLYVGTTYYFTWDPNYFSAPNATVQIVGNHINKTTGDVETESPAFTSEYTMAKFGYLTIPIKNEQLRGQGSQNISISLIGVVNGTRVEAPGPQIKITTRPGPVADAHHSAPVGAAVYIAIPTVFGFIVACVIGTCIYNKHHRRIELRSVMGRNYKVGKSGRGMRARLGLGGRDKKVRATERIQLMEREIHAEGGEVYRDLPDPADRPRRDSDALGSLAGTPTEDRRMDFGGRENNNSNQATGNAFRDELKRQQNERS